MRDSTNRISDELDLSFMHLQAELTRIDALIHREVWRWQLADQNPVDIFKGLRLTDTEANALLARPFGTSWGQTVTLRPEDEQVFAEAEAEAIQLALSAVNVAQEQGQFTRLQYLAAVFDLDDFELDTLLICLAPHLDLRYGKLYSYLQDDVTRKLPTVNLILDILAQPGPGRLHLLPYFADNASLFQHQLLELDDSSGAAKSSLLNKALTPNKTVVSWLLGNYQPQTDFGPYIQLIWPEENETDKLLAYTIHSELEQLAGAGEYPAVVFYGPDKISQEAASSLLAAKMGRLLLKVDIEGMVASGTSPLNALKLALRDARLTSSIPYITGWDACLVDDTLPSNLLIELCNYPDLVIVAGQKHWQAKETDRERSLFWFRFPIPAYSQQLALWQHFLGYPATANGKEQPSETLDTVALAGQFALNTSQIRDAVAAAKDNALQRGDTLTNEDLFTAARGYSNPRLASLARKIVPRYKWTDIVLPVDQLEILHEIVDTVRGRPLVLEEWGVGKKLASSKGITILFAGHPGTGKTMGAEIIAGELGLDLYKIDLSTMVSKYIGETEKNLEKIFREAESSNAILFFDEADAIFGKRSEVKDAHDRYANIEISYLLQRMEMYDGVTILATNLRANLDEAFTRRLQFSIDFPFPEEDDRLRIWKTLFPPEVPCAPNIDFNLLASRFKLPGGSIRNVIVSAAYLAAADGGQMTMKHLLHGTRRELQKMGRLIDEADLQLDRRQA